MAWFAQKANVLLTMGIVAFVLAIVFGVVGRTSIVAPFLGVSLLLALAGAFFNRMYGRTRIGGLDTNLALQGSGARPPDAAAPGFDPSTLVARWPTLASALAD